MSNNLSVTTFLKVKEKDVSPYGYKQILECKCGKKFRSYDQLVRHHNNNHKLIQPSAHSIFEDNGSREVPDYSNRVINGNYIEEMCSKCKTQKMIFAHNSEDRAFCDKEKEIINSCYLRICPRCDSTRRYRYEKKYKAVLKRFKRISIMTLTFKERYVMNKEEKKRRELLVRNFMKRLDRRFSNIQYIRVLEMVEKEDGYHYHYHFLIDIQFVKQELLSKMWNEVSGAVVVDIRILKDKGGMPIGMTWGRMPDKLKQTHGLNYIVKYLSNPLGVKRTDAGQYIADYDSYALYIYGSHFIQTVSREDPLTCLNGQNSATEITSGLCCKDCEQQLYYDRSEKIEVSLPT